MDTGSIGIAIGIVGLLAALASFAWTRHQAKRSARGRLYISLTPRFELDPAQYQPDMSSVLKLTFSGRPIDNFVCLELNVRNVGYIDFENEAARLPRQANEPYRPRIDLSNLLVLAVGTQNNDPNLFEIPIGKVNSDRSFILNIVRLTAGAEARFNILCTKDDKTEPISAGFQGGYVRGMDIEPQGMLK